MRPRRPRRIEQRQARDRDDLREHLDALRHATGCGTYTWLPGEDRFADSSDLIHVLGLPQGSLPAGNAFASYLTFVHPADAARVREQAEQLLSGAAPEFRTEHRLLLDLGNGTEERWVEHCGHVHRGASGRATRVVGVISDLTVRRLEDEARIRLSKFEAIGTMTSGIAHDLNNVLGPILNYAELAETEVSVGQSPAESLAEIRQAADRARSVVQRLLTYTRDTEPSREPFRLCDLVSEACALMRPALPPGAAIDSVASGELPRSFGDPTLVHQMVVNLLTNAAHAIEPGGRIAVRLDEVIIGPGLPGIAGELRPGEYLRLRVSDTGPGIDPAIADRIFDPFFTTKPAGVGTGLGLAAAQGAVRQHGGAICAANLPGGGAQFTVYLPVDEEQVAGAPAATPQRLPLDERPHVLLVDDERPLVRLAERLMPARGCTVEAYTSPIDALAALEQRPDHFDAIVTDFSMPEMSGDRLIERARRIRPDVATVLTSGYLAAAEHAWAEDQGIDAIVPKPCSIEDLADAVRQAIAARPAR